jgi:hypothetical protein
LDQVLQVARDFAEEPYQVRLYLDELAFLGQLTPHVEHRIVEALLGLGGEEFTRRILHATCEQELGGKSGSKGGPSQPEQDPICQSVDALANTYNIKGAERRLLEDLARAYRLENPGKTPALQDLVRPVLDQRARLSEQARKELEGSVDLAVENQQLKAAERAFLLKSFSYVETAFRQKGVVLPFDAAKLLAAYRLRQRSLDQRHGFLTKIINDLWPTPKKGMPAGTSDPDFYNLSYHGNNNRGPRTVRWGFTADGYREVVVMIEKVLTLEIDTQTVTDESQNLFLGVVDRLQGRYRTVMSWAKESRRAAMDRAIRHHEEVLRRAVAFEKQKRIGKLLTKNGSANAAYSLMRLGGISNPDTLYKWMKVAEVVGGATGRRGSLPTERGKANATTHVAPGPAFQSRGRRGPKPQVRNKRRR